MRNGWRRMRVSVAVAVMATAALAVDPAGAQEVQVPLDREGRVEVVDVELARSAGLWTTTYPGFREARLFRGPEGLVLEITEEREGRVVRHRLPQSAAEVEALRARISAAVAGGARRAAERELDQEGRNLLIGQTTTVGLAYYGWALPYALNVREDAAVSGLYLMTSAASFFVPFWVTSDARVTRGMADLSRYGVTRGIAHGLLLGEVLEPLAGDPCDPLNDFNCSSSPDDRLSIGLGLVASLAEGVAGYHWAGSQDMSRGTAHAIALGGDVGLVGGLLASVVLGLDDGDDFQAGAGLTLGTSLLGVYGGHVLAGRRAYTWGDAQVMYTGTALGGWTGGAVAAVLDADDEVGAAAALLTGLAGLYLSDGLVAGTDFTAGQSNLIMLSTFAGALAGAGIGVMAEDGDVAAIGSAAGGLAGFALGYRSFSDRAASPLSADRGPITLSVDPRGVAGLFGRGERSAPARLLGVSFRF